MKTIYLLFVVITNSESYEQMQTVSNKEHNDKLSCLVEKAQHKDIEGINGINRVHFFCGDEAMYFNKQQKFY